MAVRVLLVAGTDVLTGTGGHVAYVRAHAWAARRAGFEPHIVCLGRPGGRIETDFGVVHRAPLRWNFDRFRTFGSRRHQLVWRFPLLVRAIESVMRGEGGAPLIHGFGVFGWAAVAACRSLRRRRVDTASVVSAYDTLAHEAKAKLRGVSSAHGVRRRLVATG